MRRFLLAILIGYALLPVVALPFLSRPGSKQLLNVSYDPTRALWGDLNDAFRQREPDVDIRMSHGGSGSQSRAVIDGLPADVVTLALWSDTDAIRAKNPRLIPDGWEKRLPNDSLPYTSTIVFVVRKGNPLGIHDWPDLIEKSNPARQNRPVQIITPNPKTSGNGKLVFLAAWGAVLNRGGSVEQAREFMRKMYQRDRTPILSASARAATVTFAFQGIGDVHLTWENEAYLEVEESEGRLEIVYPPISLRAEPPVALVDGNLGEPNSPKRLLAERYLRFLYEPEGQAIIAKHHYRPNYPEPDAAKMREFFPQQPANFRLFRVTDRIDQKKGWAGVDKTFFTADAVFDQIYNNKQ